MPEATASASSYIQELIHVTGGFLSLSGVKTLDLVSVSHDEVHTHTVRMSVQNEGWRQVAVRAPAPVRGDVCGATGRRYGACERERLSPPSTDWQPDDLITASQHDASAKQQQQQQHTHQGVHTHTATSEDVRLC